MTMKSNGKQASTEPMYLISESELTELEIDSSEDTYGCTDGIEIAERIRARGPVVAQQAPASPCKDCTDPNQCYVPCHQVPKNPCIERGCTDIEDCDEICVHSRIFSPNWVKEHDAALIAQAIAEDRKLRPRPPCEECNWQERLEKEKAQARADVLRQIGTFAIARRRDGIACHLVPIDWVAGKLESLRSEVGK